MIGESSPRVLEGTIEKRSTLTYRINKIELIRRLYHSHFNVSNAQRAIEMYSVET